MYTAEDVKHLKEMEQADYQENKKARRSLAALVGFLILLFVCMIGGGFALSSRRPETPPASPRVANLPAATLPSATPTPSRTAWPTPSMTAIATPLPTGTPLPPAVLPPPPGETRSATYTPQPTHTPQATYTAAPTYTPQPTWTAQPTYTAAPTIAPVIPVDPADSRVANAALIALAVTALLFGVVGVFIGLLAITSRPPAVQPAPIVIHNQATSPNSNTPAAAPITSDGTPLPQAKPLRLRQRPANERRVRVTDNPVERVEPVEPIEPTERVHPELISEGGVGEAEAMLISLPFDASRPPTPAERAYIRLRAEELGSMSAACKDVYGSKGGKTYEYVRAAVAEVAEPSTSASQVIIQRRIEL